MQKILFIFGAILVLNSCVQKPMSDEKYSDSLYTEGELVNRDTITRDVIVRDPFQSKINKASALLSNWGFSQEEVMILQDQDAFKKHWWLKVFHRKQNIAKRFLPTLKDWASLKLIKQYRFRKAWQFYIEEWTFESSNAANTWLNLAIDAKDVDDAKPPRVYWVEENKMFFIMATAAKNWFEYSDELVEAVAGRKRALIELFNRPINLKEYKKKKRGANSSVITNESYYYRPDTIGTYFSYFWFQQLRSKYAAEQLFSGLVIKTYVYGDEVGTYENVKEELIGIKSKLPDRDLGNIDLVGKNSGFVKTHFGLSVDEGEDIIVEEHNGAILIIAFSDSKVAWFNFLSTNSNLETDALPSALRYYEERLPS